MSLPSKYKKIVVTQLSSDFRKATRIEEAALPTPAAGEVVVKVTYVGVNASDINFTAGKYLPGQKPPFDAGFEATGTIVALGSAVKLRKLGEAVAFTKFGAFAEYVCVPERQALPVPRASADFLPLLVSGLTAALALEQTGEMKSGQTVLVTAAAGATGLFAVQLAKKAGNHVIGTCSSDDKVALLKSLGCDRVVNYKKESLNTVLKNEYPKGLDIVYESVGGEMFDTAAKHLAVHGKLIIIGFISQYADGSGWKTTKPQAAVIPLPALLLGKSASVRGFFLNNFNHLFKDRLAALAQDVQSGKIKVVVDPHPFNGLEQVADAVDYMYQSKNVGKVVVKIAEPPTKPKSKL